MVKSTPAKSKAKSSKTSTDVLPRIQRVIAAQLKMKPDQITLRSGLQTDLNADSLDALEIVFQLEEEFHIKITEDEVNKMASVQDIVNFVTKK